MSLDQTAFDLVVVGGGVAGITTAIEAAETGLTVALVEKEASLGGRVARFHHYFPKLCPPSCGLEINFRRLRANQNVKVFTLSTVEKVEGDAPNISATIKVRPRYTKPVGYDYTQWAESCPVEFDDDYNYGMKAHKALYYPWENAYPAQWIVDERAIGNAEFEDWVKGDPVGGIDLTQSEEVITLTAKSMAWATGWKPYDPNSLTELGFGTSPDILTNVMFERLSAPNGPTGGKITAPSGKDIKSVAFVQCAGSRDETHMSFCSGVCCSASLKQASYIREKIPDAAIHMFYIDVRTPGRLEDFYQARQDDSQITLHRGKVGKVEALNDGLQVTAENTLTGDLENVTVDLVVLATGMQPTAAVDKLPINANLDENGFFIQDDEASAHYGVGTAVRPLGVAETLQDATGAAMKALQMARRS
jgi:quinone-modifying oxidoreductase, subunit QmoA